MKTPSAPLFVFVFASGDDDDDHLHQRNQWFRSMGDESRMNSMDYRSMIGEECDGDDERESSGDEMVRMVVLVGAGDRFVVVVDDDDRGEVVVVDRMGKVKNEDDGEAIDVEVDDDCGDDFGGDGDAVDAVDEFGALDGRDCSVHRALIDGDGGDGGGVDDCDCGDHCCHYHHWY